MNSLILLLVAVVAFVFGYRFYSKLLALGVFGLGEDYSTPAPSQPPAGGQGGSNRHLIFGHHLAALATAAAVMGSLVSLIWGWIPAFLWLVVGTVTAAGTYGLGSLWLSLRFPGLNPAEIAYRLLGSPAHGCFTLLAFLLVLIMNALCASLAAQLLSAFPSAVLPLGIIAVVALFLGGFLRGRDNFEIIPASLIALTLSLMTVWLLKEFPLSFTGALNVELAGSSISFDATVVWLILLFIYGYHATRMPMWKLIRPRGYLTALLLAVTLFIFYTAVLIDHPPLVAPEFHSGPDIPETIPWLFMTLTSGAVAGFHLLIANGVTARQISRETDARYIGYGGALALGLVALSAVIIGASGFAGKPEWIQYYSSWEKFTDLRTVFDLYINGFAQLAAGLGLDRGFAHTLAAVVMLGLLVATLEAGLRIQTQLLTGLTERHPTLIPGKEKIQIRIAVGLSAALALYTSQGGGGWRWWPLFGIADQILAVLGFSLLGLTLWRLRRPVAVVALPLIFMLAAANWALATMMTRWQSADDWVMFALGGILVVTELGVILLALKFLKSSPRTQT